MGVMGIRPARMEDVPEIAVVHVRSWQAAYRGLLPQAYLDGLDPSQRIGQWERSLSAADWSHGGTLVADAGGRLSGFVSYGPARDDDADSKRAGEIYAIYLMPAVWGKGIGRQLMAVALGRLSEAGFDQVILWVLDSNVRARRFYEAGGWLADGAAKRDDSFGVSMTEGVIHSSHFRIYPLRNSGGQHDGKFSTIPQAKMNVS
jgi:ribosomal protein S18 acetylase RimI-like enzyme